MLSQECVEEGVRVLLVRVYEERITFSTLDIG